MVNLLLCSLLNGLNLPTSGQVHVDDTIITSQSKNKDIKPIRKKVGLVFQFPESQLFAETVLEDVAFDLKISEFLRKKQNNVLLKV